MTDHETWRDMTAAYVVGALDTDDRAAFESHLESCERCRDEVVSFAPLPGLIARVDPDELGDERRSGPDVDRVVEAVRADVRAVERSRRRWRRAAVLAAACVVLVGAAAVAVGDSGDGGRDGGDRGVAMAVEATAGATGQVVADERSWGTYLHLSLRDLPTHDGYELWIVDRTGAWHAAGTWAPTSEGRADLGGSSALTLSEIDRVVVTSPDRGEQVLVAGQATSAR